MSIYKLKQHPLYYTNLPHTAIHPNNKAQHTPYTYLIGWSKLDIWYYGCKFSKNCHPKHLFNYDMLKSKRYETSSKYVKQFIDIYGIPDIIKIMQIFNSAENCKRYESRLLHRIDAIHNEKFLNKTNGEGKYKTTAGIKLTEAHKQSLSDNHASKQLGYINPFKDMHHTKESIEKNKNSNEHHYKFRKGKTLEELYGVIHSDEIKHKTSIAKIGDRNPMKNRTPDQIHSHLI